jgi:hypothetical protein
MREISRNYQESNVRVEREEPPQPWAKYWGDIIRNHHADGTLADLAHSLDRKLDRATTVAMLRRAVYELDTNGVDPFDSLRAIENEVRLRGTDGQSPYSLTGRLKALRPDFLAELDRELPDDPDDYARA